MASIELKRLLTVIFVIPPEGCKCLNGCSRQRQQQLRQMRAAPDIGKHFTDRLAKPPDQVQAHQLPIGRPDGVTVPRIGHPIRTGFSCQYRECLIQRDPYPHQMHRFSGRTNTRSYRVILILDIDKAGIKLEQTILATVPFDLDTADMNPLSGTGRNGKRHDERTQAYGCMSLNRFIRIAETTHAREHDVLAPKSRIIPHEHASPLECRTIV